MKASPTTVPIVLTDPEDRLSSHVRHTTLARLTRSQLDALAPFRHELGRMAEHAARVNPEGVDARGELVAVLRDVRQSLLELEKLRTRPFAPGRRRSSSACSPSGWRWRSIACRSRRERRRSASPGRRIPDAGS